MIIKFSLAKYKYSNSVQKNNNGLIFIITWITLTENVLVLDNKLGVQVHSYYF